MNYEKKKTIVFFVIAIIILWLTLLYFFPINALIACIFLLIPNKKGIAYLKKRFTKKPKIIPETQSVEIPPFQGITSISVLLVKDFIQCLKHGNYSVLGQGTPDQLRQAWDNILSQYYEIIGSEEFKGRLHLIREVRAIETHWSVVYACIDCLRIRYIESACHVLQKIYPRMQFTRESYIKDCNRIYEPLEVYNRTRHKMLCEELAKNSEKHDPEKALFETMDMLNDAKKYDTDWLNKTVMEFATSVKRYKEKYSKLKQNG